jgi:adenine-specific DNA-methyltransferase
MNSLEHNHIQNLRDIRSNTTSTGLKTSTETQPDDQKPAEYIHPAANSTCPDQVEDIPPPAEIFRPVQYLGSKLRVVDAISAIAAESIPRGGRVADLFAGSTVVSQAFSRQGFATTAVDTQAYSAIFAQALLGIGRKPGECIDSEKLLSTATSLRRQRVTHPWLSCEAKESASIAQGDATTLRLLDRAVPLAWRAGRRVADLALPLTSFYSGIYFGVKQSLDLDTILAAINQTFEKTSSQWQRAAGLTALMHAASISVHSAGKHFAQPLKAREANIEFLDRRLLADRIIDVFSVFVQACEVINATSADYRQRHSSVKAEAEKYVTQEEQPPHDMYYLDPPYTAQQYSRFYHVLETIAAGVLPNLPFGEKITSGLYSENRYKSAFSSRRKAPEALAHILKEAARKRVAVLVSYSMSESGSDGNARMIKFDELLSECSKVFGTRYVEVAELPHRYRQFNSSNNANKERDDKEVLVLCKLV